jgi:hypothetical protein
VDDSTEAREDGRRSTVSSSPILNDKQIDMGSITINVDSYTDNVLCTKVAGSI